MARGALRCPAPEGGEASLVQAPVSLPGIAANRAQTAPDTASVRPVLPLEQVSGAADGPRDKAQISLSFVFRPPSLRPPPVPSRAHSVHPLHPRSASWAPLLPPGRAHVFSTGTAPSLFAWLTPAHPRLPLLQEAFLHPLPEGDVAALYPVGPSREE